MRPLKMATKVNQCLKPFEVCSILFGTKLTIATRFDKLSIVMSTYVYILLIQSIYNTLTFDHDDHQNFRRIFLKFSQVSSMLIAIGLQLQLVFNRKRLMSNLRSNLKILSPGSVQKLRRLAILSLLMYISTTIIWSLPMVTSILKYPESNVLLYFDNSRLNEYYELKLIVTAINLIFTIPSLNWIGFTTCFYYFYFQSIHLNSVDILDYYLKQWSMIANKQQVAPQSSLSIKKQLMNLKSVMARKERFESDMNLWPLLWFGYFLTTCAGYIVGLGDQLYELTYVVLLIIVAIVMTAIEFFTVIKIDQSMSSEQSLGQKLIDTIETNRYEPLTIDHLTLINEIRRLVKFDITGCQLFSLNKPFLLSFSSGLVTFSVLFIQITSGSI